MPAKDRLHIKEGIGHIFYAVPGSYFKGSKTAPGMTQASKEEDFVDLYLSSEVHHKAFIAAIRLPAGLGCLKGSQIDQGNEKVDQGHDCYNDHIPLVHPLPGFKPGAL